MTAWSEQDVRSALEDVYRHVIERIDAGRALRRSLLETEVPVEPVELLAVGKAAPSMAEAATHWLRQRGIEPARSLVVAAPGTPTPSGLEVLTGDHPVPGPGSLHASGAVTRFVDRIAPGGTVWLLLSGGATSLMASPVAGVSFADLVSLFDRLHSAGIDIHDMNTVRKRFLKWGAGRLAASFVGARCRAFVVSDVPGNSIPSIGSGPVSPDDTTIQDVVEVLDRAGLLEGLPRTLQANIAGIETGQLIETPKPGDPVFDRVTATVVACNRDAVAAVEAYGRARGWSIRVDAAPVIGEARQAGRSLAQALVALSRKPGDAPTLLVWGGETSVTLDSPTETLGGRCQELALAAAGTLATAQGTRVALLAAGTDGRDGPTDAAGAIVTADTWGRMEAAGVDPGRALSRHASHDALSSAGALFAPGPTGTNVMDIMVGIIPAAESGVESR